MTKKIKQSIKSENELEPKQIKFPLRIIGVECISFDKTDYLVGLKQVLPPNTLEFMFNSTLNVDIEKDNSLVAMEIFIRERKSKETSITLATLTLNISFEIKGLKEFSKIDSGVVELPTHMIATMFGICASTSRGMYSILIRGTKLKDSYLPIVDPMAMIAHGNSNT